MGHGDTQEFDSPCSANFLMHESLLPDDGSCLPAARTAQLSEERVERSQKVGRLSTPCSHCLRAAFLVVCACYVLESTPSLIVALRGYYL